MSEDLENFLEETYGDTFKVSCYHHKNGIHYISLMFYGYNEICLEIKENATGEYSIASVY